MTAWTLFLHPLTSIYQMVPCAFLPLGGACRQPQLRLFFSTTPSHLEMRGLQPLSMLAGRTPLIPWHLSLPARQTSFIPLTCPPSFCQYKEMPHKPLCHLVAPSQATLPSSFKSHQSLAPPPLSIFTLTRANASIKIPLLHTLSVLTATSLPLHVQIWMQCLKCNTSATMTSPLFPIFLVTSFQ